jgi:phosphatidylinositol 4-kinase
MLQQLTQSATCRLCHLLISIDNESMALEEFIIDLCEESVNGALLVGTPTLDESLRP